MKNKILIALTSIAILGLALSSLYAKTNNKDSAIRVVSSENYEKETAKGLVFVDFWLNGVDLVER